ncbi:hypothetical protein ACFPZ0_24585 [Streptomonospora nanhaiensis]|uniref:hypothetical protein n=1 Tax=Streptomonospora nanhaiensis TaxID=1323731 RepID=UPI001C38A5FA|nr:hypothetical protein [Streptomonospora nanhaiensis]MBV2364990.1 hypothetical protein [Streptomonospora nanhaiensis]MBX9391310.1 hypothetical protein [Streptomonospora nanhaiensis]
MTSSPERLWDLSQKRADEIGKNLQEIAAEAGLSTQTVYKWRKGRRVDGKTDRRISHAFQWEVGSREAIMNGGEPTPLSETPPAPANPPPRHYPDDPQERAIQAVLETLPPEERLEVLRRLIKQEQQELRTRHAQQDPPAPEAERRAV